MRLIVTLLCLYLYGITHCAHESLKISKLFSKEAINIKVLPLIWQPSCLNGSRSTRMVAMAHYSSQIPSLERLCAVKIAEFNIDTTLSPVVIQEKIKKLARHDASIILEDIALPIKEWADNTYNKYTDSRTIAYLHGKIKDYILLPNDVDRLLCALPVHNYDNNTILLLAISKNNHKQTITIKISNLTTNNCILSLDRDLNAHICSTELYEQKEIELLLKDNHSIPLLQAIWFASKDLYEYWRISSQGSVITTRSKNK